VTILTAEELDWLKQCRDAYRQWRADREEGVSRSDAALNAYAQALIQHGDALISGAAGEDCCYGMVVAGNQHSEDCDSKRDPQ